MFRNVNFVNFINLDGMKFCENLKSSTIYLVGAGLADPDGVRVEPFVFVADAEPTDSRCGLDGVEVVTRRVGIRVCVPSSGRVEAIFIKLKLALCRDRLKLTVAVQREV